MSELIPEKYRDDEEIIRLTIEQLKKDFGTHFPELKFSGQRNKLFDELAFQIADVLSSVRKSNPVLFKVILYRVDVRESEVSESWHPRSFYSLSEKVIQREFQKVLTKRFFSGQGE